MDKNKYWYIYTIEYYSAIKKNEILPFIIAEMDIEGILLSEVSRSEKDKVSYDFTYMGNLKKKINKQIKLK